MSKTFLIIDCNFICHRAKHSIGPLEYKGKQTGVIYGFLTDIMYLMNTHRTRDVIFCWDYGKNLRKEIYPKYKANRNKDMSPEEVEERKDFQHQVKAIREKFLPEIGFNNVFYQWGYESDDLIAAFVYNMSDLDEAKIITSDKDLYQCIRHNVSFAAPGKPLFTLQGLHSEYAISPHKWSYIKTLAGCPGDNVKGIQGVGIKTALKYVHGKLAEHTQAYKRIVSPEGRRIQKRNYKLVTLPYPGAKCEYEGPDNVTVKRWNRVVVDQLGMKSIRNMRI